MRKPFARICTFLIAAGMIAGLPVQAYAADGGAAVRVEESIPAAASPEADESDAAVPGDNGSVITRPEDGGAASAETEGQISGIDAAGNGGADAGDAADSADSTENVP